MSKTYRTSRKQGSRNRCRYCGKAVEKGNACPRCNRHISSRKPAEEF
jgi:primosomal protein N'